jgi:hypothetical protein
MQIQIEIDEAGVRLLNEIKEKAGLNDYRAVFDNGIALLSWAVRQRADGSDSPTRRAQLLALGDGQSDTLIMLPAQDISQLPPQRFGRVGSRNPQAVEGGFRYQNLVGGIVRHLTVTLFNCALKAGRNIERAPDIFLLIVHDRLDQ